MMNHLHDDGSKRVKRIAAVVYLLLMAFVVVGSYLNQHYAGDQSQSTSSGSQN
jgi:hypothetical protein